MNKNNELFFCLNCRQTGETPEIQQKNRIFKKLSPGLSTGSVEMFSLEYHVLSLQP
jgi:hypothetical protein